MTSKEKGYDPYFIIYRDTREKRGFWTFAGKRCVQNALKTGDYTIKGFEQYITIDRKRNIGELSQNLCQARFWKEVDRMKKMIADGGQAHFIFEFCQQDVALFPYGPNTGLPWYIKRKIKIRPPFIFSNIKKIEDAGIGVHYGNDREGAIMIAQDILERFIVEQTPNNIARAAKGQKLKENIITI
jgi:hypothetical protein